jgi:hypothetical protein
MSESLEVVKKEERRRVGNPTIWSQRVVSHDFFIINTISYVYVAFEWNASDSRIKIHKVGGVPLRVHV